LDDPQKTAVVSKRGMGEAIGLSRRGNRLTVFLSSQNGQKDRPRASRKNRKPPYFQRHGAAAANPIHGEGAVGDNRCVRFQTETLPVIGVRSAGGTDWTRLLAPWRLTPAEARLAAALVRAGDLRGAAAAAAGVGYETARDTIAAAMAKTGARRQPEFVQRLAALAFGELLAHGATWQTLADAYDLSARQAGLAQLIAVGATRPAAAALLGVSGHTAKADLKLV
jgi:DNA-binding CsgD family transcriptional regulator